ncbi:dehydrogenase [Bombilactobacillus bombi]|uniref:Dehydrogenase n=1 Tax=Bombilactobacillus bombi TaxID=1303590 RepID=A0A3R6W5T3_9LACO|nr:SagB family peptide dehydrogenase [Bombilactobacillus bombi]RHW45412.1 dehydrogenase [Bombilactobacillus bombi]
MIDIKNKGLLNSFTNLTTNSFNKSNLNNQRIYSNVISGKDQTPSFSYLRNLNCLNYNDLKSMVKYNEINYAAILNEAQNMSEIEIGPVVKLPRPDKRIRESISKTLELRKSVRKYSGNLIDLSDFSTILHYSFGTNHNTTKYETAETKGRYFPSGGGLYPIDVIVFCNKVEQLKRGFYKYQPRTHTLLKIPTKKFKATKFFPGGIDTENSNFIIFFRYSISKTYLKYGELGMMNVFIEIGCMSENFDLVTSAMGRGSCPIAGFSKQYLENILYIDGVDQYLLFSNVCGDEQ